MDYDYLIIGGGISGTTAAEQIRKIDKNGRIAIFEDESHLLYSRVFLPAYAKGDLALEKVMLRTLGDYEQKRIDIYLSERVLKIDFLRKEVFTQSQKKFSYQKLLLATGGRVESWELEKDFSDKIFRLQTLEDALRLKNAVQERKIKEALVVGGGFIALEFLNIFYKYSIPVTLLLRQDFFWQGRVEREGGRIFEELFSKHKISFLARQEIAEVKRDGGKLEVRTTSGNKIRCEAIAAGLGLKRNLELFQGLPKGREGIRVNEFLETSLEGVFAAGDAAEYFDEFSGRFRVIGNWTHGFLSGVAAGLNMAGERRIFRGVSSYSIKALSAVVTLVGETDENFADQTLVRFEPSEKKYVRFFLKEGRLIGAALFNTFELKPLLAKLIENKKILAQAELTKLL